MTEKILVPLDGSPQAIDALTYALTEFPDADVAVLHVIDPIDAGYSSVASVPGYSEDWYENEKESAETLFERAHDLAADHGADLDTAIELGRPSRVIVEYAVEHEFDHIVIGSHGRSGVSRILLGSVAETVVRRSPIPVTVVR